MESGDRVAPEPRGIDGGSDPVRPDTGPPSGVDDAVARTWQALQHVERSFAEHVEPRIRMLAIDAVEAALGARDRLPRPQADLERAAVRFAEQFVVDVGGVDDQHVADLSRHWDAGQVYAFTCWVQAAEAQRRVALICRHHRSRRFA